MRRYGLSVPADLVAQCDFQQQTAADATARMLRLPEPPTAIFAASDLMAAGVYEAARWGSRFRASSLWWALMMTFWQGNLLPG